MEIQQQQEQPRVLSPDAVMVALAVPADHPVFAAMMQEIRDVERLAIEQVCSIALLEQKSPDLKMAHCAGGASWLGEARMRLEAMRADAEEVPRRE